MNANPTPDSGYTWPSISRLVFNEKTFIAEEAKKMRDMALEIEGKVIDLLIQKASVEALADALGQAAKRLEEQPEAEEAADPS